MFVDRVQGLDARGNSEIVNLNLCNATFDSRRNRDTKIVQRRAGHAEVHYHPQTAKLVSD